MGLPVVGFVGADSACLPGAGDDSGLGVAEAVVARAALLVSDDDVLGGVDGVADVDWARARGEKKNRMAVANTRRFIVVESLPE